MANMIDEHSDIGDFEVYLDALIHDSLGHDIPPEQIQDMMKSYSEFVEHVVEIHNENPEMEMDEVKEKASLRTDWR